MTVEFIKISKSFGSNVVLKNLNYKFSQGEIIGIVGKNGSGKTTLLKMGCGILPPDEGNIYFDNMDLHKKRNLIMKSIGTLFDSTRHLHWRLTAIQNFRFFSGHKGIFKNCQINEAVQLFSYFKIDTYLNERVEKLSLGTKKKVALCCALAHHPSYLFLDEPTNGLDQVSKHLFTEFLTNQNSRNRLTFIASHDYEWIENYCSRIVNIEGLR